MEDDILQMIDDAVRELQQELIEAITKVFVEAEKESVEVELEDILKLLK